MSMNGNEVARRKGRASGRNGHGTQEGQVAVTGAVSVKVPHSVRNGIILYGQAPSLNGSVKLYWVKKRRIGTGRFAYACTCEGSFLGNHLCCHIATFRLAEVEA